MAKAAAAVSKANMARLKKRMAKLRAVRLQYVLGAVGDTDAFVTGLLRFEIEQAMDQYRVQRFRAFNLRRARASHAHA